VSLNDFISLSEFLLGVPFQPPLPALQNLDPDLGGVYFDALATDANTMDDLLNTWTRIQGEPEAQRTDLVNSLIMSDDDRGPLARQIILAWYTGFHPYFGTGPKPAPENYEKTLVWYLAQAHPMGVPQSFGYWQFKPE
jgi:hypothetical protein